MTKISEGFPLQRLIRRSQAWRRQVLEQPIASLFCITEIGHFPDTQHHWIDREKGLEDHVLIYNRSGVGRAFIGGHAWKVPPQHLLIVPKDVPHSYGSDESLPWSIYWMHITGTRAHELMNLLGARASQPLLSVRGIDDLLRLFESLIELAAKKSRPEDAPQITEALLHLVNTVHSCMQNHRPTASGVDSRIDVAMAYMRANLHRSCSLEEIARASGLSVPHFSALFRSHAGSSPLRFFTRWRIQKAAQKLESTNEPINMIAAQFGYEDPFYFSKVFRQYIKQSPRAYRQQLQKTSG